MAEKDNVHKDHRGRVRKKFIAKGFAAWEEHEVLEMLLFYAIPRVDTNPIAHKLIKHFGSLALTLDASVEELMQVEGIGEATAVYISALGKLPTVYNMSKWINDKKSLFNVTAMGYYCVDYIGNELDEVIAVITLDNQYNVKNREIIACGLVDYVPMSVRKIAEIAIRTRSKYIVLCHNHPSGNPQPSNNDINTTKNLIAALEPLNIDLIDHVVVGGGRYVSMADKGYLHN